ncbi:MAG: hypothetical protein JW800_05545 [Candidatus Omnitrophica bacterium]|nr:hypothetical protein [Candidatus Omnitrophota bacterium]
MMNTFGTAVEENVASSEMFPLDIFAAKEHGIEKWRREFMWPLSDEWYARLCGTIEAAFVRHIVSDDSFIKNILLIQSGMRSEIWHYFHAVAVIRELREKNITPVFSDRGKPYSDIMRNRHDADGITVRRQRLGVKAMRIEMTELLRPFIYNFVLNKVTRVRMGRPQASVYGSLNHIMAHYLKRYPYSIDFMTRLHIPYIAGLESRLKNKVLDVSKCLARELTQIAGNIGIPITSDEEAYVRSLVEDRLVKAAQTYMYLKGRLKSIGRTHLWLVNPGDIVSRALCTIVRENMGRVTTFTHGGNTGLYDTSVMSLSEFAFADEFITYSGNSIKLFERIRDSHTPQTFHKVRITSSDCDYYNRLRHKCRNGLLPKRIKKVMLIGYPHNQTRNYQANGYFSPMRLDLELRLVDMLKKAGYEVIYKVHPDRRKEIEGVFDSKVDVIGGYFENCLDKADAFLFGHIRTTSFPAALCTNKPIIALEMEGGVFRPFVDAMDLLKKRCTFVRTSFDERNRIVFDEDELLSALAKNPEPVNNEYVERYYFAQ